MKRKGFTLVELLAVIVVLAIISIITIPMIGNVIEESRKKALEVSANGLVEAARYYTINHDGLYEFVFDEDKKGETIKGEQLDYKGNIEGTGKLYIDQEGDISLCLVDDKYYVYKNYNSGIYVGEVKDNNCIIGYDVLTNKYIAMLDDGTGQISNVYSKEEVNNLIGSVSTNVTNNTNEITSIKESINTISTIVNNNTNTNTTNTSEISSINENINTLTATVDNNTNIITTNTNEISNIKGTIETLQSNLSNYALQSSLNTTNNNLNNLSSVVTSNTNNINSLQTSISDINSNLKFDSFEEYRRDLGFTIYTVGKITTEIITKVNDFTFFHTRVDGSVIENNNSGEEFSWINIDSLLSNSMSHFGVSTIDKFVGGYGIFRYYPNLFTKEALIGFAPIIVFNGNAIELSRIYDIENGYVGSWQVKNIPTGIFGFDIYWIGK